MKYNEALSKAVQEDYNGFDDVDDEALAQAFDEQLEFYSTAMTVRDSHTEPVSTSHYDRELERIHELEDPDTGMISTFLRRKNLEGKNKRKREANEYRKQVSEGIRLDMQVAHDQHALKSLPLSLQKEKELTDKEHEINKAALDNRKKTIDAANRNNLPIETFLKVAEKAAIDKLELAKINKEARDEIENVFILEHFPEYQRIEMAQTQLDQAYQEIALLEKEKKPGWEAMKADREKTIKALREHQNGLRAQLAENSSQKVLAGTSKKERDKRDPRQRMEEADD